MKKYNFSGNKYVSIIGYVLTIVLSFCLIGFTIAFFSSGDFSSGYIGMSGAVDIEIIGHNNNSIENTSTTTDGVTTTSTNLLLGTDDITENLDPNENSGDNFFLVPESELGIRANCKVKKSATHPLLRANISFVLTSPDKTHTVNDMNDAYLQLLLGNFKSIVSTENTDGEWFFYNGYFYFVEKNQTVEEGKENQYILTEVNVSDADRIVTFINSNYTYPADTVNSTYAGYYLQIIIKFEGIQNFIPNKQGARLENTIENSLNIFANNEPEDKQVTT